MENQQYLETAILGADRLELIRMLYRGAIAATQEAREHLRRGEIMLRSKAISRALDFISELTLSLNHDTPGGISQRLADLYQYVQQLLLKAHANQSDAKLGEAISILETMLSAWNEVKIDASAEGSAVATRPAAPATEARAAETEPGASTESMRNVPANPYSAPGATEPEGRSWDL